METLDASVCPLCGVANQCAMEIAKATGKPLERCWCVDTPYTHPPVLQNGSILQTYALFCSKNDLRRHSY